MSRTFPKLIKWLNVLVGGILWKMYKNVTSSLGHSQYSIWKVMKFVPNHQPVIINLDDLEYLQPFTPWMALFYQMIECSMISYRISYSHLKNFPFSSHGFSPEAWEFRSPTARPRIPRIPRTRAREGTSWRRGHLKAAISEKHGRWKTYKIMETHWFLVMSLYIITCNYIHSCNFM